MMRMIVLAAATLFLLAPDAKAHSWYPFSCCSDNDCEMIPPEAVLQMPTGYKVHYVSKRFGTIDEAIPMAMVKSSQDSNFHGCWRAGKGPRTICFFAPLSV